MKTAKRRVPLTLLACLAILAAGCTARGATESPSAGPIAIECQVFYRPSMGESFQEIDHQPGPRERHPVGRV